MGMAIALRMTKTQHATALYSRKGQFYGGTGDPISIGPWSLSYSEFSASNRACFICKEMSIIGEDHAQRKCCSNGDVLTLKV
jgi:hypothetical protein